MQYKPPKPVPSTGKFSGSDNLSKSIHRSSMGNRKMTGTSDITKFYKITEETPRNMNMSGRANAPIADEMDPDESVGDESCFDAREVFERTPNHGQLGHEGNTMNSSQFTNVAGWSALANNDRRREFDAAVDQMSF